MKKILFIFLLSFSITTFADDHIKPQEGAFTSLYVSAADIDKYVSFLKKNSTVDPDGPPNSRLEVLLVDSE